MWNRGMKLLRYALNPLKVGHGWVIRAHKTMGLMSNYIPHKIMCMITYSCMNLSETAPKWWIILWVTQPVGSVDSVDFIIVCVNNDSLKIVPSSQDLCKQLSCGWSVVNEIIITWHAYKPHSNSRVIPRHPHINSQLLHCSVIPYDCIIILPPNEVGGGGDVYWIHLVCLSVRT